jgi:glyoxylase-like metal-dependent hydrolase (beta-lactamase superfamily II)
MIAPKHRFVPGLTIAAALLVVATTIVSGQQTPVRAVPEAFAPDAERQIGPIHVVPIRRNRIYLMASAGGNSTVQVGDDGVLVVDTMTAALAPRLLDAIRTVSMGPILQIINTNADRTGGNEVIRKAGRAVGSAAGRPGGGGAAILAFDAVLTRMSADGSTAPQLAWPTDTYFVGSKDLFFNAEPVQVYHEPAAYSDADTLVVFRRSDVVVAGDVFTPHQFPRIDVEHGGTINGIVAGLNRLIELTVPELNEEGGTMVVPAAGRLCDEADVADYRDMVTIVRDRIQDMVRRGLTLQQVKAARPTRDYDPLYNTPTYTSEMFVEAAYQSLSRAAQPRRGVTR